MATDNTTANAPPAAIVAQATPGQPLRSTTIVQMAAVLESLLNHTHTYYDDYGSNCNCNCNCTRGSL